VLEAPEPERDKFLRARQALEGPIRQMAETGHASRAELVAALQSIKAALIAGGRHLVGHVEGPWQGVWDLRRVTDDGCSPGGWGWWRKSVQRWMAGRCRRGSSMPC
jgi:hypothetical protein